MNFAVPGYYNLAILVAGGAVGYYSTIGDAYRYTACAAILVLGVLLPFAVRMYRSRLPVDDMPMWRNGIDDLRLLYLIAFLFVILNLYRVYVLDPASTFYWFLTRAVLVLMLGAALLVVMEACLLGCETRAQIMAVLAPFLLLGYWCPAGSLWAG